MLLRLNLAAVDALCRLSLKAGLGGEGCFAGHGCAAGQDLLCFGSWWDPGPACLAVFGRHGRIALRTHAAAIRESEVGAAASTLLLII